MTSSVAPMGQDLLPKILVELDPAFAEKVSLLISELIQEGIVVRPYSGLRSPLEQALLWCQSRTPLEQELITRKLIDEGATYLAAVLKRASTICAPGRWATNNLPGQSWHNFGLALDSHVVSEDGRAVWGPKHFAYTKYAELARKLHLFAGHDLVRQDVVHIQWPHVSVHQQIGSWAVVNKVLEKNFPQDAG